MKKVGIVTICDYSNYGNRLQNYASQEIIKSLGCRVETIVNVPHKSNLYRRLTRIKKMSSKAIYERIKEKILSKITKKEITRLCSERIKAFMNFTDKNIHETNYSISDHNIPLNLSDEYDYFVVGSDQVWNPIFRHGSPIDFLTFAPKDKRIAYAPSFGISAIPEEYIEDYKLWISEMESLSVREEAGAKIIKDLTGRDAVVLVDPTLMLSKEKWLSISKQAANKPSKKYLLTYFLGNQEQENEKKIREIALEHKLEIVNLADIKDAKTYIADPSEFIDYINSASIFFTDSFHGAVFSILLEKSFIILDRIGNIPSMNSRIDTLLSTFNLQSRKWSNIKNTDEIFHVDYTHIAPILEFERNKALKYLKEALHIKDKVLV